jgi:hypothetical protein
VTQIVRLNTPGVNDGGFQLSVNGIEVINVQDVYYRGAAALYPTRTPMPTQPAQTSALTRPAQSTSSSIATPSQDSGDLLGGLLDGLFVRNVLWHLTPEGEILINADSAKADVPLTFQKNRFPRVPPSFTGLFFSTFFGGHGETYATPRDQYTWFKDFNISIVN